MTRTRLFIALGLLAAALTITAAVALAAPKKGVWQAKLKSASSYDGPGAGYFRVASGPSIRNGNQLRYIVVPAGQKCGNPYPTKNKIPVKNGKFLYKGAAVLNPGESPLHKGKLTWTGKFVTKKKVKGTIRFQSPVTPTRDRRGYVKKRCDTGTRKWVGKFSGPS